jgi:hypothetical protein
LTEEGLVKIKRNTRQHPLIGLQKICHQHTLKYRKPLAGSNDYLNVSPRVGQVFLHSNGGSASGGKPDLQIKMIKLFETSNVYQRSEKQNQSFPRVLIPQVPNTTIQ